MANYFEKLGATAADIGLFIVIFLLSSIITAKITENKIHFIYPAIFSDILFTVLSAYLLIKRGATFGQNLFELRTISKNFKLLPPLQAMVRQILFSTMMTLIVFSYFCTFQYRIVYCWWFFLVCLLLFFFFPVANRNNQTIYELLSNSYEVGKIDFSYLLLFIRILSVCWVLLLVLYFFVLFLMMVL